jgi:hypothetical protein
MFSPYKRIIGRTRSTSSVPCIGIPVIPLLQLEKRERQIC